VDVNPYDVATKEIVWDDPLGWVDRFGIGAPGPATLIVSDITTVSAGAVF
jgi:hypothetical protein